MLSKNEAKYIQSLKQKKFRQKENLFIAEGPKLVNEILNSHYKVKKLIATADYQPIANQPAEIAVVEKHVLAALSTLQNPHQVLAVVEQPSLQQPILRSNEVTICLDGIQDPGNLGTIIRLADWFGIKQLICNEDTAELFNPKVIQSTMGSFLRVNVCYANIAALLQSTKMPVLGAFMQGNNLYERKTLTEGVIVIGNEGRGISTAITPYITEAITIPRKGGAESLNAAVATGIILSHLL